MPHVAFVPFTGFRVRDEEMRDLGMAMPGLQERAGAIGQLPALGVLTLAGMVPPSWSVSLHESGSLDLEDLAERVLEERPDLVAVSALTASVEEAYRFSGLVRRAGVPVVLGGLHATACPEEARRSVDAVVVGDGESSWPVVLQDAERLALRPIYRSDRPFDLRQAPMPRFDLLGKGARPRFTIQTQRGCPLACDFCGASRLLGPWREKPAAKVAEELGAIRAIEPRPVAELADDNTFAGRRETGPLLEALAGSRVRYFTEVDWRVGERPEILERLAASGCVQVLIGLESLEIRHAGMGPKAAPMARMMEAVAAIQEAGVAVIGCFVVGAEGETEGSLDRLGAFLESAPLADVQLTLQTPFPGTALYDRLRKEGRLLPDRGWSSYTLFDVTYRPDAMSVEALEMGFRGLVRRVFSAEPAKRRRAIRRSVWARHPGMAP
ncbi:B12-binding domain-containing radical SAM protein [Tautonia rosea]|uniref:B12-binding domain-containing radical SAM protein n=1 Tax=Tautonia rosea TaxID=2728037 RepID=UPI0019CF924C|nr:radical SAM protein [Tautonia rosea]